MPDMTSMFPELVEFKMLARLAAADAYVRSADGDGRGATAALIEGIKMSRAISSSSIISFLVGIAHQAIVLAAAEELLPRLSHADARMLISYAEAAIAAPTGLSTVMQREKQMTVASVDEIFNVIGNLMGEDYEERLVANADAFVAKLTPSQRALAKAGIVEKLKRVYDDAIRRYEGDETGWVVKQEDDGAGAIGQVASVDDLVDLVAELITPVMPQLAEAALKSRAQLRLLGLHARIIDYRWRHGVLPNQLSDAVSRDLLFDPMAKAEFVYERQAAGYKLYGKGLPSTGPIELKYVRPANLVPEGPIPP